MKNLFKMFSILFVFVTVFLTAGYAFADTTVVAPQDFLSQVLSFIQTFGGLPWLARLAGIITLVIASFKVSFLDNLIWNKLGGFKVWAAPILSIAIGICSMGTFSWAKLLAYLSAGVGAVFLHEILDSIKSIPGLGASYVAMINLFEGLLGGTSDPAA